MRRIVILIIVLILLFIKKSYSSNDKENDTLNLQISGKVTFNRKEHDKLYRVELIKDNKVIDSMYVKEGHSFKFLLQKANYYGIRITKKGFISVLISVCTYIDKGSDKTLHHFHFDTRLISEDGLPKMNKDALDFPIAIISFNNKKRIFTYNKKYTTDIKRKMHSKQETKSLS